MSRVHLTFLLVNITVFVIYWHILHFGNYFNDLKRMRYNYSTWTRQSVYTGGGGRPPPQNKNNFTVLTLGGASASKISIGKAKNCNSSNGIRLQDTLINFLVTLCAPFPKFRAKDRLCLQHKKVLLIYHTTLNNVSTYKIKLLNFIFSSKSHTNTCIMYVCNFSSNTIHIYNNREN